MNTKYHFQLTLPKNRGEYLIFSLPQTNQYQIINNLLIQPSKYKLSRDDWKNRVAIFRLNDVIRNIKLQFTTLPRINRRTDLDPNFRIKDYNNVTIKQFSNLFKPNRFINGKDKKISELVRNIVKKQNNLSKIVRSLYDFTLDSLIYGKPIAGLYSYKQAMEERITDCGGFSTFLASLLQAVNIPSRLVVGFLIKEDIITKLLSNFGFRISDFGFLMMHAWLEILLPDGSWFPLDPSTEWRRLHGLSKRQGGFGYIPADRLATSLGEDFSLRIDGKIYHIDLLQKPVYL